MKVKPCKYLKISPSVPPFRICRKYMRDGKPLPLCVLGISTDSCDGYEPKEELKPCPFCGGEAIFVIQQKYFGTREAGIWCKNRKCLIHVWHRFDASVRDDDVRDILTELWNRRAET